MSISDLILKKKAFTRFVWHPPLCTPSSQQLLGLPAPPASQPRYRYVVWEFCSSHSLRLSPSHDLFHVTHITNLNSFLALLPSIICKTSIIYLTSLVSFLFNLFNVGILSVFYSSAFFSCCWWQHHLNKCCGWSYSQHLIDNGQFN